MAEGILRVALVFMLSVPFGHTGMWCPSGPWTNASKERDVTAQEVLDTGERIMINASYFVYFFVSCFAVCIMEEL